MSSVRSSGGCGGGGGGSVWELSAVRMMMIPPTC